MSSVHMSPVQYPTEPKEKGDSYKLVFPFQNNSATYIVAEARKLEFVHHFSSHFSSQPLRKPTDSLSSLLLLTYSRVSSLTQTSCFHSCLPSNPFLIYFSPYKILVFLKYTVARPGHSPA